MWAQSIPTRAQLSSGTALHQTGLKHGTLHRWTRSNCIVNQRH